MKVLSKLIENQVTGYCMTTIVDHTVKESVTGGTKDGRAVVDSETLFSACSISKLITAVLILKACDEGLITLKDDVNKYFKNYQLLIKDSKNIVTIEDLLINESGIEDGVSDFGVYHVQEGKPDLIDLINGKSNYIKEPIASKKPPKTEFLYADSNTLLLEKLIVDLYHIPYRELAHMKIFTPLDMKHSVYIDFDQLHTTNLALGHNKQGHLIDCYKNIYPYDSVAGLWTTSEDLSKLMIHLLSAYQGKNNQLLQVDTAKAMFTSHGCGVSGYGVFAYQVRGKNAFSAQGWGEGFQSYVFGLPDEGDAIIILTNTNPNVEQLEGPIGDVIRHYINERMSQ